MLAMADQGQGINEELLLDEDQSWAFPIVGVEENGSKLVVDVAGFRGDTTTTTSVKAVEVPLPAKGIKNRCCAAKSGGGDGESADHQHELHIRSERERRKKMRNMFANLQALVPHLTAKADKSAIVDEAVTYIRNLQQKLNKLQKQKDAQLNGATNIIVACNNSSSIVTLPKLAMQSREAFLAEQVSASNNNSAVTLAADPLFSGPESPAIFKTWTSPNVVLSVCGPDAHFNICGPKKPGLLSAVSFVLEKYKLDVVSLQVSSGQGRRMYMIHARASGGCDQFPEGLILVEEIYKQAAIEIMLWINS